MLCFVWFDLVDGALGVFNRSIASLQYVIEDAMQDVLSEFLDSGADAFAEASVRLGGDEGLVANELKRVRAQDAIDSFDTDAITQTFPDELENNDRKLGQASAKIFGDWAIRNLRFRSTGEEKRADDVFTYEFTRRVDHGVKRPFGRDTLIPAEKSVVTAAGGALLRKVDFTFPDRYSFANFRSDQFLRCEARTERIDAAI